ncbi:MAG: 50S ribosome-binding GTPase [Deltaproteobacteria bacterium]|nr:50S ribosome-binding GTPase [Desulfobacterales bacterium]MCF8083294.1 50S ribosome-binding GTPase [Deltaproteobacteria bacterium]
MNNSIEDNDMSGGGLEAKVAEKLIKIAIKQGWFDKLVTVFQKKHKILLLGSTGVGKTNLVQSLTEITPKAIHHMNRTEFIKKQHIKIAKKPFVLIDTPGQAEHKYYRKEGMLDVMKEKISGIINVVSYGYHEYRIGVDKVYRKDGSFRANFLKRHRENEIEAIKKWTPLLGTPELIKWIITVVTKADLWWDYRESILQFYEQGKYYDNLGEAKSIHHVVEYCSVIHKFYGKGRVSGLFDDSDRIRLQVNLLRTLTESIGGD